MKLIHGTCESLLPKILKEGIRPRRKRDVGNWANCPSHAGRVYLTNAYGLYYGVSAHPLQSKSERVALIEVDTTKLRKEKFYPDEDFIAQVLYSQMKSPKPRLEDFTQALALEEHRHHWELSLDKMGNASYLGRIPPRAISRYALVPLDSPRILSLALDPSITLANYKIMGDKYRALMEFCFGGPIPKMSVGGDLPEELRADPAWAPIFEGQELAHSELAAIQARIEVVSAR